MEHARRWSWVGVLVVGLALFWLVRRATLHTDNPNLIPSLILLGAAVIPVTFVAFIAGRRIAYGVSGGTLALTALIGGVIGVVTAGVLEFDTLHDLGMLPMVAVGLIEESAKLIAPLALVFFLKPRRPADGLLIGVASGAGFATLETMGYGFVELIRSNGSISALDDVLFLRGVLSPAAHMAWTGLTAAALWYAAERGWQTSAVLRFVGVFAVAVALHATWDSLANTVAYLILAIISLGLLGVTTHRASVESRSTLLSPIAREKHA
ncbi:PrsW family intramembrane metalloprotease [Cryptosporangium phraense]|uniref:PrsW family intramembrane metalloprotease n=1 Tax=Cryptosporangium phraense TaxID=2593070 RepID=A0A545AWE7_9ACTN|nr:PrsW family intramembrane metalloprotease [Cryptosporangium phraense]TQS45601.1 PrsW family intramembrane metalloprotease [Cryptosporangium phraense]